MYTNYSLCCVYCQQPDCVLCWNLMTPMWITVSSRWRNKIAMCHTILKYSLWKWKHGMCWKLSLRFNASKLKKSYSFVLLIGVQCCVLCIYFNFVCHELIPSIVTNERENDKKKTEEKEIQENNVKRIQCLIIKIASGDATSFGMRVKIGKERKFQLPVLLNYFQCSSYPHCYSRC